MTLFGQVPDEDERLRRTAEVVRRLGERISREAPPDRAPMLWAETFFVRGLRYRDEIAGRLLQGVRGMRDSLTYQAVLEEGRAEGRSEGRAQGLAEGLAGGRIRGRAEEARRLLRRLGERRFGPPSAVIAAAIDTLEELERIERATLRLLDVTSWDEALAEPTDRPPPA